MTSEYEFRLVNLRNRIERKAEVIFLGVFVDAKLTINVVQTHSYS